MNCRLHLHELKADAFMNCPAGMNCRRCLHGGVGIADGLKAFPLMGKVDFCRKAKRRMRWKACFCGGSKPPPYNFLDSRGRLSLQPSQSPAVTALPEGEP